MQLTRRGDVDPKALRGGELEDGKGRAGLGGEVQAGVGKDGAQLPGTGAERGLVEDVERRPELRREVARVAAADLQMGCVVHPRGDRQDVFQRVGHGGYILSGAPTPSTARAFASTWRVASASHNLACVSWGSSEITRQSR